MSKINPIVRQTFGECQNAQPGPDTTEVHSLLTSLISLVANNPELATVLENLKLVQSSHLRGCNCYCHDDLRGAPIGQVKPEASSSFRREPDRLMRLPEVLHATGLKRATLYEKISLGRFPAQVSLGRNMVAWYESEVQAWIRNPT